MNRRQRAACHDHAVGRGACEGCDRPLDLAGVAHVDRNDFNPERWCNTLDCGPLPDSGRYSGVSNDGRSRHAWRNLLQQFQPFPAHAVFKREETSGVAPWPRQAIDEPGSDRIGNHHEHDREGAGDLQQRCYGSAAIR